MSQWEYQLRLRGDDDGYLSRSSLREKLYPFQAEFIAFYHREDFTEEDLEIVRVWRRSGVFKQLKLWISRYRIWNTHRSKAC